MGKNISIYLPDEQVSFINAQKEGASQVVQKAISLIMKADKNKQGYDEVLAAAEAIGKAQNMENAIKAWRSDRDIDRW